MFKPLSPLMTVFCLMEVMTTIYILGYWFDIFHRHAQPWENRSLGSIVSVLFIASNILIFRHRRAAILGFAACWLVLFIDLLPAV